MPQTYTIVSGSERVVVHPERSRTGSGGSASNRSVRSARSAASSGGSRSGGSAGSSWSEVGPPYGEEDEIVPSDSASRSRQPSTRRSERRPESTSRPAPQRRHSSRRSVLREEAREEDAEPRRRHRSSHRNHTSRSSRHRRGESRRVPSDESSSTVASHDDYPYGHHGRYPPQGGYRHVPAPVPPQGHGGYAPSVTSAPQYPDPYAAQALVHMQPPPDPFGYASPNPFTPQGAQGNPFSPMGSAAASSYFGSEPAAPPIHHPRPPPMPRPASYMVPPSHYGSEMMSAYGPPAISPYAYGMMPGMAGYPPLAPWYSHPASHMSPPPQAPSPEKKEDVESFKALLQKHEEERVAREQAMIKKAEADAAALAAAKAKEEAEKKQKEEVAAASKKAKEEAEKEAAETAKKAKEEHEKKLKEAEDAKAELEKKHKEVEEEVAKLKPPPDTGKQIRFKDAVGRKFNFPFHLCKTWKGMEGLIRQAFSHIELLGDQVKNGHYDLTGPDGEHILPGVWEHTIQPDMEISMHMWPTEEKDKGVDALVDPFLGMDLLGGDPSKKPKKKGSKKEKSKSHGANIVDVGPSAPGAIPPPPAFPPGFGGVLPDPLAGMAGIFPPPPPVDEKKDKAKRPAAAKSKSSKEVSAWSAFFAGGAAPRKKK